MRLIVKFFNDILGRRLYKFEAFSVNVLYNFYKIEINY